jgi:hypothetical protein
MTLQYEGKVNTHAIHEATQDTQHITTRIHYAHHFEFGITTFE